MLSSQRAFYIFTLTCIINITIFSLSFSKILPLTIDHALYICQKAVTNSIISLPHSLPTVITFLFVFVIFFGIAQFGWQIYKTRHFLSIVLRRKHKHPEIVIRIAKQLSIRNLIDVSEYHESLSFCYGLINPRICITVPLIDTLTEPELKTVIIHELSHVKNYDPLKILLIQAIISMFFFVPILKDFQKYYALTKEIDADQLVVQFEGSSNSLKKALSKLLQSSAILPGVASFSDSQTLEERVMILTGIKRSVKLRVSAINIAYTIVFIVGSAVFLQMPVYAIVTGTTSHNYFICSSGKNCNNLCKEEGIINEVPFTSQQKFTPISYR